METKTDITAILKDKLKGTKLYSTVHGNCNFVSLGNEVFQIKFCTSKFSVTQSGDCTLIKFGHMFDDGECVVFPSKEMRDWGKFAWKKGDLLINSCGFQCIFKEWASDDYTKFNGCYSNSRYGYEDVSNAETAKFDKLDNNIAYGYVREIERKLGGILNLTTLEIEKQQVVELKSKVEIKPFDKVLVRNDKEDQWSANIFSYQVRDNMYYCLGENYWRYCIPYIGNESLLGTTKDVEG